MKKNNIAIIPARGGSKRLPNKNIKLLKGKPLISYTIEAALRSKVFDTIMVSTDDEKIAKIAIECGAEVPYLRPENLSTDFSTTISVIENVVDWYKKKQINYENLCLLQPTSPLRSAMHIEESYKLLSEKVANAIYGVTKCQHSPLWSNVLNANFEMDKFIDVSLLNVRSQDLPNYYRINGSIYWIKCIAFESEKRIVSLPKSFAYVMKEENSVDIDNEIDFKLAEFYLDQL
jgi:pseudaminic acid cytidylyltransferase